MNLSASMLPLRTRKLVALVVLALVPVLFLHGKARLAQGRGPLWLGSNSDPSYVYLLNALQLADTGTVFHVDHPGTTVQAAGALILSFSRFGAGTEPWVRNVLGRAEHLAELIVALANAGSALVLYLGGCFLHRRVNSLAMALLAQGAVVVFSVNHGYTATWLAPELFFPAIGFAFSCVCFVALREGGRSRCLAGWAGVLGGLGLLNKMTFLPYLAMGILCFRRRPAGVFFLGIAATLLPWLWVVRHQLDYFAGWVARLALHSGRWGEGSSTVVDVRSYPRDLAGLLTSDPLYLPLLALGMLLPAIWFLRNGPRDPADSREVRALLGLTLMNLCSFLLVAKHPAPHYLVPMVSLAPLGVLLTASCLVSLSGGRLQPVWLTILLVPGIAWAGMGLQHELRRLEQRHAAEEDLRWAALSLAGGHEGRPAQPVFFYRASSPQYALMLGNVYTGRRYARILEDLYPGATFLDPWSRSYEVFAGPLPPDEFYRRASGVVLVGSEDLLHTGGGGAFPVPPGTQLREVLQNEAGRVYVIENE